MKEASVVVFYIPFYGVDAQSGSVLGDIPANGSQRKSGGCAV